MITPSKKDFIQLLNNGKVPPLYKEILYSSPCLIYESLASTNSFLLESIKGPEKIARYSFIGFNPYLIFKIKDGLIEIETPGETIMSLLLTKEVESYGQDSPESFRGCPTKGSDFVTSRTGVSPVRKVISEQRNISLSKPLSVLKAFVNSYRQMPFEYLTPFQGGAVGILNYDFVQYLERVPRNAIDDLNLPDAHFLMIDKLI
ncbi:MAG: hypothetical protein AB1478_07095, partial [Nitrospirota bacterium]